MLTINGDNGNNDLRGWGFSGDETVNGLGGDDKIQITSGADIYNGGDGNDTLYASDYAGSVDLNLSTGELWGTTSSTIRKTAVNFENYEANSITALSDVVRGNDSINVIRTYGGDDTVYVSDGANDFYDGGVDRDTLNTSEYYYETLTFDMESGSFTTPFVSKTARRFENYEGTQGEAADNIFGDAAANVINTYGGDDFISGGDGDDTIDAGLGANSIWGGLGRDTAILSGNQVVGYREGLFGRKLAIQGTDSNSTWVNADVEVLQFNDGTATSWEEAFSAYNASLLPPAAIDPATGNPRLRDGLDLLGGKKADSLVGSALNDDLNGSAKNDTLFGGAGADHFHLATGGKQSLNGKSDFITDFSSAEGDKLVIHRGTFGAGSGALVICADNAQLNAALSTDASFAYNQASGQLFYNQNGSADGFGKPKLGGLMATLTSAPDLITSDFIIL
jgi:Ca2+-binding RTX toxin-like protein